MTSYANFDNSDFLPQNLAKYLPGQDSATLEAIKDSIVVAITFPWDSPERIAIGTAFEETYRIMIIVAIGLQSASFLVTFMLKDLNLRKVDETWEYGGMVIGKTGAANALKEQFKGDHVEAGPSSKVVDDSVAT